MNKIMVCKASYTAPSGDRITATRVIDDVNDADAWRDTLSTSAREGSYVHTRTYDLYGPDDIADVTGGYWFTPDTMRSFGSRILSGHRLIGHRIYFVSSEWTGFDRAGRGYSVRVWDADTDTMDTIGEFNEHATAAKAKRALANIAS